MLIYGEKKIRFRDREGPPPSMGLSLSGEVKCILYDENMNILLETEYQKNVITNEGMNYLREGTAQTPCAYTYVGSGNTAAVFSDGQMQALLPSGYANNSGAGDKVIVQPVGPNYEYSGTKSKRFGAGFGTGTVREVGMGGNTAGTQLVCRQVLSSPITKGATQSLDVIWRWTAWPEVADKTGVINIGGIDYNYILRPQGLAGPHNFALPPLQGLFGKFATHTINDDDEAVWDGDIASMLTGTPAGTRAKGGDIVTEAPYVPGTFDVFGVGTCSVDVNVHAGLTTHNISSGLGIRSTAITTNQSKYQCQFNAVSDSGRIPKTASNELDLNWRFSWSRHGL